MNSSLRQGYCSKCELRLVWKYSEFGKVSSFVCPYCRSTDGVYRTTYYLIKKPTLKLLKPIKVHDSVYKCPHDISEDPNEVKNCDVECGYDDVIAHQIVHKGMNKDSPYYDDNAVFVKEKYWWGKN